MPDNKVYVPCSACKNSVKMQKNNFLVICRKFDMCCSEDSTCSSPDPVDESIVLPENYGVTETKYLFFFDDGKYYDMYCAVNFKDAIWEMSKYTGTSSETFRLALRGFVDDDITGMVKLYNSLHPYDSAIQRVVEYKNTVYQEKVEMK